MTAVSFIVPALVTAPLGPVRVPTPGTLTEMAASGVTLIVEMFPVAVGVPAGATVTVVVAPGCGGACLQATGRRGLGVSVRGVDTWKSTLAVLLARWVSAGRGELR